MVRKSKILEIGGLILPYRLAHCSLESIKLTRHMDSAQDNSNFGRGKNLSDQTAIRVGGLRILTHFGNVILLPWKQAIRGSIKNAHKCNNQGLAFFSIFYNRAQV